ncbi:MAG: ribonuclease III [Firmicutes bacterium]|nr:ribonuclease III [Bacillota bacterium]MBR2594499.1 ribonuclease III [Bacillota bacterium]
MFEKDLSAFENTIGYIFKDKELIKLALTHSSYANEVKGAKKANNERLEFLGDAVLELGISEYIYKMFPEMPEGELTKLRAGVVCEPSLAKKARYYEVYDYMFLGKGEEASRDHMRDSILADAFESIIGAIYLDGGFEPAKKFLLDSLKDYIDEIKDSFRSLDCKTKLQEIIQRNGENVLKYEIVGESGPDHDKVFYSNVMLNGKVIGKGEGKSKKEADQSAAMDALKSIGEYK